MSFYTSLTGLNAATAELGIVSNNIANVGTIGFKKARAEFGDIFATSPLQNASGSIGQGVLLKGGKPVAYYNTGGASYGLQAGAQQYGYAMFFMNEAAVKSLDKAEGFEVGVGPSVVVMDEGMAKSATTTTMDKDVYAFIFGQQGLMAGLGIQGNKITKINPK